MSTKEPFERTFAIWWSRPPLTENQRTSWQQKARVVRTVREYGRIRMQQRTRVPHFERIDVTLTWVVADRRRRDADNIVPTLKALCDGIVDAGVVDDDTPDRMVKHMPVILFQRRVQPHFELTIKDVS